MTGARIGVGLIGAGRHGRRYARHLREDLPGLRLAGLVRRDPAGVEALSREFGCAAYADPGPLLADPSVDVVALVVPPAFHRDLLTRCLLAGKPVLLEKPAAMNLAEGNRMLGAAARSGLPVMVAQTLRYNETVAVIREALPRIGRIHSLRVSQRFEPSETPWIHDLALAGAGTMLHTGVHGFDLVRFLGGMEADRVSAEIGTAGRGPEDDNFSAVLRLAGGRAMATVSGCRATASRTGAVEIAGDRGQLVGDYVLGTAALVMGSRAEPLPVPAPVSTIAAVLRDFERAVRGEIGVPVSLETGLRAVALVEAAYLAARGGRAVPVPAPDPGTANGNS